MRKMQENKLSLNSNNTKSAIRMFSSKAFISVVIKLCLTYEDCNFYYYMYFLRLVKYSPLEVKGEMRQTFNVCQYLGLTRDMVAGINFFSIL